MSARHDGVTRSCALWMDLLSDSGLLVQHCVLLLMHLVLQEINWQDNAIKDEGQKVSMMA